MQERKQSKHNGSASIFVLTRFSKKKQNPINENIMNKKNHSFKQANEIKIITLFQDPWPRPWNQQQNHNEN